jgi:hypothetical protein
VLLSVMMAEVRQQSTGRSSLALDTAAATINRTFCVTLIRRILQEVLPHWGLPSQHVRPDKNLNRSRPFIPGGQFGPEIPVSRGRDGIYGIPVYRGIAVYRAQHSASTEKRNYVFFYVFWPLRSFLRFLTIT